MGKPQKLVAALVAFLPTALATESKDFTSYVNPFLGTEGPTPGSAYQGGNVFPGATLPFGAVKVGIDTTRWDTRYQANAGYTPEGNVTAITMLHVSGTGGAPTYGLIPQMPLTSIEGVNLLDNLTYMQQRVGHDVAEVGYYKTELKNGIIAEMSASQHAGIMRYNFPADEDRNVLVDISHYLPTRGKETQWYSNGKLERSPDGSRYSGYGVYREGWALGGDFKVYFCGQFNATPSDVQLSSGIYTDPYWPNTTNVKPIYTKNERVKGGVDGYQYADRVGALFNFPSNVSSLTSRVGVSWVSVDKACQYIDDEIPHWDLNTTVSQAKDKWNKEVLFRSMIDIWRHERFMPEGRSHNHNGRVQGGSNSDNILADAYVKKLDTDSLVNWTDGYAAMRTNAELQPYNNFDFNDPTGSTKEGRSALDDWKKYGYVSTNYGRSMSKTAEYSLNDFALSQVAKGEAPDEATKYLNRSAGWQRIWKKDATSHNFTGFLAPLQPNGTVLDGYDPLACGDCNWESISYEGTPWEYSFTVPHDMVTLIKFMGGPKQFEKRLDTSFVPGLGTQEQGNNGIGSMICNPGNEPSFMTPFLYNFVRGRQWKSVMRSKAIVDEYYHTGASGIPGNDDAGSMSSWLVWNMLGLYPVVTQPVYLILSPRFDNISIKLGQAGGTLRMNAQGLSDGPYIQSLKVNGKAWDKSWISHDDLVGKYGKGSLLEFTMGAKPVEWDSGELPPSPGTL